MDKKITIPGRTGVAVSKVIQARNILNSLIEKISSKDYKRAFLANEISNELNGAIDIFNSLYKPDGECPADEILLKVFP